MRLITRLSFYLVTVLSLLISLFGSWCYVQLTAHLELQSQFFTISPGYPAQPPFFGFTIVEASATQIFLRLRFAFIRNPDYDASHLDFSYNLTVTVDKHGTFLPSKSYNLTHLPGRFSRRKISTPVRELISAPFIDFTTVNVQIRLSEYLPSLVGVQLLSQFIVSGGINFSRTFTFIFSIPIVFLLIIYLFTSTKRSPIIQKLTIGLCLAAICASGPCFVFLHNLPNFEKWALCSHKIVPSIFRQFYRFYVWYMISTLAWPNLENSWLFLHLFFGYGLFSLYVDTNSHWRRYLQVCENKAIFLELLDVEIMAMKNEYFTIVICFGLLVVLFVYRDGGPIELFWGVALIGIVIKALSIRIVTAARDFATMSGELWAVTMELLLTTIVVGYGLGRKMEKEDVEVKEEDQAIVGVEESRDV
jgi:hypothetical protein